jgi:hypothetical protein
MTKLELADMLDRFVGDQPDCGDWEWDDFTSVKSADSEIERYRLELAAMDPPFDRDAIRGIARELRENA